MISPMFDILDNWTEEKKNVSEEDSSELPEFIEIPRLRRHTKIRCHNCKKICPMIILVDVEIIMCFFCSQYIKMKHTKIQESLKSKKNFVNYNKKVHQDIIIFGLNPDRIEQTIPFETLELFETKL